jgi:opacity protein-like surface antigen
LQKRNIFTNILFGKSLPSGILLLVNQKGRIYMSMKKIALATAAGLALAASSAFAVTAQSGVYVGALGGYAFAKAPSADTGVSKKNKNYTWGGTLGYDYALNQNALVGAEVSYENFGKTNYNGTDSDGDTGNVDLKNSGYQLLATGTYLLNNGFTTFVKAGAIHEKTDVNGTVNLNTASGDETKWIPAAAIGAGYMFNQNLNVALQYEHTFGSKWTADNDPTKPMTQDVVTLGVTYKFAM